jgi:hypothetical protein
MLQVYLPQQYIYCTAGTLSYSKRFHQGGYTFFQRMKLKKRKRIHKTFCQKQCAGESEMFCCKENYWWVQNCAINIEGSANCIIICEESSKMAGMPKCSSLHSVRQVTYSDYLWMDRNDSLFSFLFNSILLKIADARSCFKHRINKYFYFIFNPKCSAKKGCLTHYLQRFPETITKEKAYFILTSKHHFNEK